MLSKIAIAIALMALLITVACSSQPPTEPTVDSSNSAPPIPTSTPAAANAAPPPQEVSNIQTDAKEPSKPENTTEAPQAGQHKVDRTAARPSIPPTPGPALADQSINQPLLPTEPPPSASSPANDSWAITCLPADLQEQLSDRHRRGIALAISRAAKASRPNDPPKYKTAKDTLQGRDCQLRSPVTIDTPAIDRPYQPLGQPLMANNFKDSVRPNISTGWPQSEMKNIGQTILGKANAIIEEELGGHFEPGLVTAYLEYEPGQRFDLFERRENGSYHKIVEYFDEKPITPGIMGDHNWIPDGVWVAPLVWYNQNPQDSQKVDYQVFYATLLYHNDLDIGKARLASHTALLALKFSISFDHTGKPLENQDVTVCVTLFHHPDGTVKPFEGCSPPQNG